MRHLPTATATEARRLLAITGLAGIVVVAGGCDSIRLGGWPPPPPGMTGAVPPGPRVPPVASEGPALPGGTRVGGLEMPTAVRDLLSARCAVCHVYGDRDPAGWGSVLDVSRMIDSDVIVPGDPARSRLWQRVAVRGDMPFNAAPLALGDLQVLHDWITRLPRPFRQPRTTGDILDLLVRDRAVASDTRYVSFAHFVDEGRSADELRIAGADFAVILNSLSRSRSLVVPVAVDPERSIWRFRLADLGWSQQDWDRLTSFYPFCLRSEADQHLALYDRLGTEAPVVRGDWFLATAPRPPLYFDLLHVGDNLDEFARTSLGVDLDQDLATGRVQTIPIRAPGVTLQDRVLERHALNDGGYLWIDADEERNRQVLWSLPNGLQAYLLAEPTGARIDAGPPGVVAVAGVENGTERAAISCHRCHGITGPDWPGGLAAPSGVIEQRTMDPGPAASLELDAARYGRALRAVAGDLGPAPGTSEWADFVTLAGQYDSRVGLRQAAVELSTDLAAAAREAQPSPGADPLLPLTATDPLVPRDVWTCRFRATVGNRPRVRFCRNTFDAPELDRFCQDR
jgi:hypothetical protein